MKTSFYLLAALMAGLYIPQSAHAVAQGANDAESPAALQSAFINVAKTVKPAVVTIACDLRSDAKDPDEDTPPPFASPAPAPDAPKSSLGTGVIIRSDGWILTNYHVVRGAELIRVLIDSDSEKMTRPVAKVVGFDEDADLAVLKINRTDLPTVSFANSDDVQIGQWALAIGAPFDQPQTFTAGIISAIGRHLDKPDGTGLQDYIQTDASINPGNSGGPLLDLSGHVVGINTAILSPSRYNVGIGFSVPSKTIQRLLPTLMAGQKVQRGFLGIQYVRLDDAVAHAWGVKSGVQIGGLAEKDGMTIGPAKDAGLQEDDILETVEGTPIDSTDQFRSFIATKPPGSSIVFGVARPGDKDLKRFNVTVKLGDRAIINGTQAQVDTPPKATTPSSPLGIAVNDSGKLSADEKTQYGLTGKEIGAVITKIDPGSPSDDGDLHLGLRIVRARVDGIWKTVASAQMWRDLEKAAPTGAELLVQLRDKDDISVYKVVNVPKTAEAV